MRGPWGEQCRGGAGIGSSKKYAKTEAARQTLEILIPEFKKLLPRFDSIKTLYNQKTGSLARVPNLELSEMSKYINTILAQDPSCVLHTEQVSSVFSGSLL